MPRPLAKLLPRSLRSREEPLVMFFIIQQHLVSQNTKTEEEVNTDCGRSATFGCRLTLNLKEDDGAFVIVKIIPRFPDKYQTEEARAGHGGTGSSSLSSLRFDSSQ